MIRFGTRVPSAKGTLTHIRSISPGPSITTAPSTLRSKERLQSPNRPSLGAPNNSMEPTRPAGCCVRRDTSLGWPGGSSRGRSASRWHPSTSIYLRPFHEGRRPPAVGAVSSSPQFPRPFPPSRPARQLSPSSCTRPLGRSQRWLVARRPGISHLKAQVLPPNNSLKLTRPAGSASVRSSG